MDIQIRMRYASAKGKGNELRVMMIKKWGPMSLVRHEQMFSRFYILLNVMDHDTVIWLYMV